MENNWDSVFDPQADLIHLRVSAPRQASDRDAQEQQSHIQPQQKHDSEIK